MWCILNRVDERSNSIYEILRAPDQFAFCESKEVREDLYDLAKGALSRWDAEPIGLQTLGKYCRKSIHIFVVTWNIIISEILLMAIMIRETIH